MGRYNAAALMAGMGAAITVSQEDNDLNININADHEGDGEGGEAGVADFDNTSPADTEATDPAPEVVVDENIDADTSGAPETAELDVAEAGGDVDEVATQIEDVNDTAAGLEGIVIQLATISQEGIEVTPFIAESIRQQYNFVTRKFPKLRVDAEGQDVVASTESWTVSQEATTDGILGKAVGKLKNAGAAVVKFLKDLWEKIKALFGSVTSASSIMRKKATALKGRAADAQKSITLPGTLTSAPFNAAEINKLTALVKSVAGAKIDAGKLVEQGWSAFNATATMAQHKNKGTYLGNFTVDVVDNVPVIKSAEATKAKNVNIRGSEVAGIATAVIGLADAIDAYKREESLRKAVNDRLLQILQEEVKPEDATKYARWRKARETSTKWGKFAGFEGKLIQKAIAVGNAANNALAAGTAKPEK